MSWSVCLGQRCNGSHNFLLKEEKNPKIFAEQGDSVHKLQYPQHNVVPLHVICLRSSSVLLPCPMWYVSVNFVLFLFVSIHFSSFFFPSVLVPFSPLLYVSVSFCPFQSIFVHFNVFMSDSVCLCLFLVSFINMFTLVHYRQFMYVYVYLSLLLSVYVCSLCQFFFYIFSLSAHFCLFLSLQAFL